MTSEEIRFTVQVGLEALAVIGVILIIRSLRIQNTTLKSQVQAQKDLITGMQQYQNIIKLDEVEKYVAMRERTISQQTTEEKAKLEQELKRTINSQEILNNTVNEKTKELDVTKENLDKLSRELATSKIAISRGEQLQNDYVERIVELMNASILLIATYIPKEKWQEFVDQEVKKSNTLFTKHLLEDGEKIYEEEQKRKSELAKNLLHSTGFVTKIIKSRQRDVFTVQDVINRQRNKNTISPKEGDQ